MFWVLVGWPFDRCLLPGVGAQLAAHLVVTVASAAASVAGAGVAVAECVDVAGAVALVAVASLARRGDFNSLNFGSAAGQQIFAPCDVLVKLGWGVWGAPAFDVRGKLLGAEVKGFCFDVVNAGVEVCVHGVLLPRAGDLLTDHSLQYSVTACQVAKENALELTRALTPLRLA